MRDNDVRQHAFAYNLYILLNCLNPRHVRHADLLPEHTSVPTIPTLLVLYHTPVRFSLSYSSIYSVPIHSSLSRIIVPSKDIIWIFLDSVINSFGSQLSSFPSGIVNHYILEMSILNYRVTPYIPSGSCVRFTTLSHFTTIFIEFIILSLLSLLSPSALHIVPIVLLTFLMEINLVIILITVII